MPHNRAEREQDIRNKFEFIVFADTEVSLFTAALAIVEFIYGGGHTTIQFLKNELGDFGVKAAIQMTEAGVDPTNETIYGDVMTFQNWEEEFGIKVYLPNKFVPYIAAGKRDGTHIQQSQQMAS